MKLRKALLSTGNAARLQQGWLSDCSHGFDRLFSVCQLLRSKALLLAATSRHAFLHETVHISCQSSPVTPHVDTPYSSFITLLPCCRMSRDQRSKDNWALLYACEVAQRSGSNVVVAFNLVIPRKCCCYSSVSHAFEMGGNSACTMDWLPPPVLHNKASKTMSHRILRGQCMQIWTLICPAAVMNRMFCKQRTLRVILKLNHCCHAHHSHSRHSNLHCAHVAFCSRKDALWP